MIEAKTVRPLAVTSRNRDPLLPDVPTMTESGYPQVGFDPDVWQAIVAPAGTPRAVIGKLNAEVNETLKLPEVLAALDKLGFEPQFWSVQQYGTFLAAEMKKWPPIVKASGVQPE